MNSEPESQALPKPSVWRDLTVVAAGSIIVFILSARWDLLERAMAFSRRYEAWELDEVFSIAVFLVFYLTFFAVRRAREAMAARDRLARRTVELETALAEMRQLERILPICMSCKRIRDDAGYWHQVETYIHEHTGTSFSHGICAECAKKLYPDVADCLEEIK